MSLRRERQRSLCATEWSTSSSSPAFAISGGGTERGPSLPWASLLRSSCSSQQRGVGIGHSKQGLGDALGEQRCWSPFPGASPSRRMGWLPAGTGCDGVHGCTHGAEQTGSCLQQLLSHSLWDEGERGSRGSLCLSPASSKEPGSAGRSSLGWDVRGSRSSAGPSRAAAAAIRLPLTQSGGVPPCQRLSHLTWSLGGCLSPVSAGESPGSSLHKAAWSQHAGQGAPRQHCSLLCASP